MAHQGLYSTIDVSPVVDGLDHPEGVNFGPDGMGYAGGEAGQVYRFSMYGTLEVVANTNGGIGGLCLDASGNLYECNYGSPVVHKVTPQGQVSIYSRGTEARPAIYPNYPVFDSQGNLFFSDSGNMYHPSGALFVVRPNGETVQLAGNHFHFPNGLAIDAEEKWLYMIQSTASNILRFPLRNGVVGEPEIYVTLPETVPDGLAFSRNGNLYVACYAPDAILRVTPRRRVETVVFDPLADRLNRPTNVAFAPNTTQLCFANLGGFAINSVDVGETGQPLQYPQL